MERCHSRIDIIHPNEFVLHQNLPIFQFRHRDILPILQHLGPPRLLDPNPLHRLRQLRRHRSRKVYPRGAREVYGYRRETCEGARRGCSESRGAEERSSDWGHSIGGGGLYMYVCIYVGDVAIAWVYVVIRGGDYK